MLCLDILARAPFPYHGLRRQVPQREDTPSPMAAQTAKPGIYFCLITGFFLVLLCLNTGFLRLPLDFVADDVLPPSSIGASASPLRCRNVSEVGQCVGGFACLPRLLRRLFVDIYGEVPPTCDLDEANLVVKVCRRFRGGRNNSVAHGCVDGGLPCRAYNGLIDRGNGVVRGHCGNGLPLGSNGALLGC